MSAAARGASAPEIAERALALAGPGEAQVTVMRERSLVSRFSRSAPTQATAVDDTEVVVLVVRDGHTALASTNRLDDDALRDTARRADAAARASAHAGAGGYPGLARARRARQARRAARRRAGAAAPDRGFDAATARLDPAQAGAALAAAFAVAAEHGLEAFGIWTAGAVRTAIASSTGLRRDEEVTDAFMKVICRDAGGRTGFAAATAGAAAAIDAHALARQAAAKVGERAARRARPGHVPGRARARRRRRAARVPRRPRVQRAGARRGPRRAQRPARRGRRRAVDRPRRRPLLARARCRTASTSRACARRR